MYEISLHMKIWVEKAKKIRRKLNMPIGSAKEIEAWLNIKENKRRFIKEVIDGFTEIAIKMKIDARYLNYFASCVLTHHKGSVITHSLPDNICFDDLHKNIKKDISFPRDSFYRIVFVPHRYKIKGTNWRICRPPRAFTIAWPNHFSFNKDLSDMKEEIGEVFDENLACFNLFGYAYKYGEQWIDGRLLYGPGIAGKTYKEILGLNNNTPLIKKAVIIPYLQFGDDLIIHCQGGAPIDEWGKPHVEHDPNITGKDKEYAKKCDKLIHLLVGNKDIIKRGAKKKYKPEEYEDFKEYVKRQYREEKKKSSDSKSKIWNRVKKRAERYRKKGYFPIDLEINPVWKKEVEEGN